MQNLVLTRSRGLPNKGLAASGSAINRSGTACLDEGRIHRYRHRGRTAFPSICCYCKHVKLMRVAAKPIPFLAIKIHAPPTSMSTSQRILIDKNLSRVRRNQSMLAKV